jgi:diguanylate cyclase (GGDEF)-like protein
MVEQKRTQLFLMLVQQSGIGSLPLSFMSRADVTSFVRNVEHASMQERCPVFVYWSSRDSQWMLPESKARLMRDALCVTVFSEEREDKHEEFCFITESQGLCTVLYGYRSDEHNGDVFQCVGTVDPELVRRAFQMMLPVWQFLDLSETNRLEDARMNAGVPATSPKHVQGIKNFWTAIKAPPQGMYRGDPQRDTGEINLRDTSEIPLTFRDAMPVPPPGRSGGGEGRRNAAANIDFGGPDGSTYAASALAGDAVIAPSERLGAPTMLRGNGGSTEEVAFVRADVATTSRPRKEKRDKSLRELREVWTAIAEESREVFPPDAQRIIRDIMGQLRHSSDHQSILQMAIEELMKIARADRGLVWQVVGDQLTVTNEFAASGDTPFIGTKLGSVESTEIIREFISRFPDEGGTLAIHDTKDDERLHKTSPTLATLIELGEVRARVVAQLRCIGRFHGFLELQQSTPRQWSELDAAMLQSVAETLSIVVQQAWDLERRESDANEMKLINSISDMFRESKGQRIKDTLARSVRLVADNFGFVFTQVFLLDEEARLLLPQISGTEHAQPISLDQSDNPFVHVAETGKVRIINSEYTRKGDKLFGHEMALVVALESEGETLGVLGLWKQNEASRRQFRPVEDPKLLQTICNNLASIVRADQAIAQIRSDRQRERLLNQVNTVIRQSPRELDQILDELVRALLEHFSLALSVVALYDAGNVSFVRSKSAGDLKMPDGVDAAKFAEDLFMYVLPEIEGIPILEHKDLKALEQTGFAVPQDAKLVTVVPAIHRDLLKAAICLISTDGRSTFSVADMNSIKALAELVAVDIAHKELFEQVERQAVTDPMTGLHNRRHFGEQLSKEIDRNQRFGHPFSYIIIDLDFLKKINDTHGHQFGDEAIKHIANVVKKCVRDVDTTARYGGEEFVVLLPETDVQGARVVAERMCYSIRELPVEGIGSVTASIGVATFPYDATDRDKLTELADQSLYLAKHRGRNQVCSVSEDLIPSLNERGEEALEIQKATIKAKADEMGSIDLRLVAEYGLLGILGGVMKMIEAKDAYANDRSPRAADYASRLANSLHLSKEHTTVISLAAILHNIGKIGIAEEILQKKEALTPEERRIIEQSPSVGAKILEPAKHLHRVASVVESYHENWDGTGYPKGLRGEQIPLESRIIALVDAYVAMTSDRPYRDALSSKEAAALLQIGAGKQFDPRLVKLFLSVLNKEGKS